MSAYSADDASSGYINGSRVQLRSTGTVTWPVQVRARTVCDVDMTYFPFDNQLCLLRFGSWLYSDRRVLYNVCQRIWIFAVSVIFLYRR